MTGKLRIIHIASTKRWTGVAEPMVNLAFYQKGLGHDVSIICEPGRSLERYIRSWGLDFIGHFHLSGRTNPVEIFQDIVRLRRVFETEKPDVIHCHLLHDHWIAFLAMKKKYRDILCVRTMHRFAKPYADPIHAKLFTKWTGGIFVPTESMGNLVLTRYPQLENRLFTVYGGVNLERYHPRADCRKIRLELGIPLDSPVAGVVSRLRQDRGFKWLFETLPLVWEKIPKAKFLIVGQGELTHEIESLIQEEPFKGRVFMAGYRSSDLPEAYAAMDVSLFLAMGSEGGCRAAMEAMAMGRPVIGLKKDPVPEIISPGECGFVVSENDAGALADCLAGALSDPVRLRKMGKSARIRAEKTFTLRDKAIQSIQIYKNLKKMMRPENTSNP